MISGFSHDHGGIAAFDGTVCGTIDNLTTQGLALRDGLFFRAIGCGEQPLPASELLVYDARGVFRYQRLDGVWDVHDVLPRDGHTLVVATEENTIFRVDDGGRMSTFWRPNAQDDSWHVNCLTEVGGEVYATAFGMFDERRDWSRDRTAPTGVLLRVPDEQVVLSGLTQPHNPRWIDDTWVVCNSGRSSLDAYDAAGRLVRRHELPRYPRGLAFSAQAIFVGSSTNRSVQGHRPPARVTMLDRNDWSVIGAFDVEWPEIYDLAIVPRDVADGVANGFRTNPSRVRQHDQLALFAAAGVQPRRLWAVGEPLTHASLSATVDASVPPTMKAGEVLHLPCRVTNRGDAIFVTAPPNPVQVCYRWYDAEGRAVGAGSWLHTPLGRALAPAETIATTFRVRAPEQPGRYTLAATLLQENVAWFDDVDATNGQRTGVVVE